VLLHARVGAGKDVKMAVPVDIHELWSGAGASPHAWYFGHLAFGLQPDACRKLPRAQVLEDPDLSLVELADEQVLFAVPVDVGPARRCVARAFDADRDAVRLEELRALEFAFCGAAQGEAAEGHERCEW